MTQKLHHVYFYENINYDRLLKLYVWPDTDNQQTNQLIRFLKLKSADSLDRENHFHLNHTYPETTIVNMKYSKLFQFSADVY